MKNSTYEHITQVRKLEAEKARKGICPRCKKTRSLVNSICQKCKKELREDALTNDNYCCRKCKYMIVEALEVHHIDKNRSNNSLSNLVILCCNCHRLVHRGIIRLEGA